MGEIMNSPKVVKSGVPDPHVARVTNHTHKLETTHVSVNKPFNYVTRNCTICCVQGLYDDHIIS